MALFTRIWEKGEKERLTGHQEIESITNGTLVTEEVDTTSFFRLFLLFLLINFRTEGDTTTNDNVGVYHLLVGDDFFVVRVIRVISVDVEVCSRTHLANVSGEGTLCVLHPRTTVVKIKVVRKNMFRLIVVRV